MSNGLQDLGYELVQYVLVLLLGGGVGAGELVSRYKDAPGKAIKNTYGLFYITINSAAALLALVAIKALGVNFGINADSSSSKIHAIWILQAMAAGFGAMAIFRSSAFIARVGDQDVAIGPSAFLTSILAATDREVDRRRAEQRADAVQAAMAGIDFQQSNQALPILALALMQNLPGEDEKHLNQELEEVRQRTGISNSTKSLCLGLSLMNVVGEDVLTAAVSALKKSLDTGGDASLVSEKPGPFSSMLGRWGLGKSLPAPTQPSPAPPSVTTSSTGQTGGVAAPAKPSSNEPLGNGGRPPSGLVT